MTCERCGNAHLRCTAHNGQGAPCGKHPVSGATVCRSHGGAAPQVRSAALERAVEAEIDRALASLDGAAGRLQAGRPVANPLERLLALAGETDAWLTMARERVGALLDADNVTTWTEAGEDVRALVKVYERALDRTAAVLAIIAKLKIDDRLTAIAERDYARLEQAVTAAWAAGHAGQSLEVARTEASRALRVDVHG